MDFTPTPRYLEEVRTIMNYLVPDYLNKIPAEKLSEFIGMCTQVHNAHWQMAAVDAAREEKAKEDSDIVGGKNKMLDFKGKLEDTRFLPNDDLPFQ